MRTRLDRKGVRPAAVPAVPGVDRGEADQVADPDRRPLAAFQHVGHVAFELAAVGQAGQRVGEGLAAVAVGVALRLLGVEPGRHAVEIAVAQLVDALGGEAERVTVGGVGGGVIPGRGVADAA